MKKNLIIIILTTCSFLISCKSDDTLTSGGAFKITASTGTTKTMTLSTEWGFNKFIISSINIDATNGHTSLDIDGLVDAGKTCIYFFTPEKVTINKEYSTNQTWSDWKNLSLLYSDWVNGNYEKFGKGVIKFSSFNYPGRITGTVFNYDKNNQVLSKGEFDFITTKAKQ